MRATFPMNTSRGGTDVHNHIQANFLEITLTQDKEVCLKCLNVCCVYRSRVSAYASVFPHPHLSASTSSGVFPWAQLFTIQPESMAARKPRAIPVPIGQKGWRHNSTAHSITKYGQRRTKDKKNTKTKQGIELSRQEQFRKCSTVQHSLIGSFPSLTSNRLSPTSATSSLWPCRWRTMAAFSDAYMQVKSNMATSGWP